jgi:ADP-ribosylglycohydrolase
MLMAETTTRMDATREARRARALESLDGLSIGDGFGEQFFVKDEYRLIDVIRDRQVPVAPWSWTDDTEMALSIVQELHEHDAIDQDALATRFARRWDARRGYGQGAARLLARVREGEYWGVEVRRLFQGQGSFGNGAAMRVAPLGAYFADDLDLVVEEAKRSSEVTHAHDEGIAGGVAVAMAAALCARSRGGAFVGRIFLRAVAAATPPGYTRDGIVEAAGLPDETTLVQAATALGNGAGVTAPDTVPFSLWCVARCPDSFVDAMWTTVAALGDRDTTCAIVGGVLTARLGGAAIPAAWRAAREPLPVEEGAAWAA